MKVSIIDIGTQSLKHYIFDLQDKGQKKVSYYKRHSDANLGEHDLITPEAIARNVELLTQCLALNKTQGVTKEVIFGTDILRKAGNAPEFIAQVKTLSGLEIKIITQDQEAKYLYEGFLNLIPPDFRFAAANIGGGSTEVVVGSKKALIESHQLPFGVKALRKQFDREAGFDWRGLEDFLSDTIPITTSAPCLFVTGVLDIITTTGSHFGARLEPSILPGHPVALSTDHYEEHVRILQETLPEELKQYYTQDPTFCDNSALAQTVYVAVAKKLGVKTIIPSRVDLTDGVVYEMLNL